MDVKEIAGWVAIFVGSLALLTAIFTVPIAMFKMFYRAKRIEEIVIRLDTQVTGISDTCLTLGSQLDINNVTNKQLIKSNKERIAHHETACEQNNERVSKTIMEMWKLIKTKNGTSG